MSFPFSGPVPPESNPPINPQYYKPKQFFVSSIILGQTTLVTTSVPNDYTIGQLIRMLIPFGYGTTQLSGQTGYVIAIPSETKVEININSTNYDTFVPVYLGTLTKPQIIAIGDVNTGVSSNSNGRVLNGTFIPGSFINISPA